MQGQEAPLYPANFRSLLVSKLELSSIKQVAVRFHGETHSDPRRYQMLPTCESMRGEAVGWPSSKVYLVPPHSNCWDPDRSVRHTPLQETWRDQLVHLRGGSQKTVAICSYTGGILILSLREEEQGPNNACRRLESPRIQEILLLRVSWAWSHEFDTPLTKTEVECQSSRM